MIGNNSKLRKAVISQLNGVLGKADRKKYQIMEFTNYRDFPPLFGITGIFFQSP